MPRLSDLIPTALTPSQAGYLLERDHRGHHKSAWFLDAAAAGLLAVRSDGPNVTVQRGTKDPKGSAREVLDALFEHGEVVAVGDDRPDFRRAWEIVDKQLEQWSLDTATLKPRPFRRLMRWSRPRTELGSHLADDAK
jgi:hypothetical protein